MLEIMNVMTGAWTVPSKSKKYQNVKNADFI